MATVCRPKGQPGSGVSFRCARTDPREWHRQEPWMDRLVMHRGPRTDYVSKMNSIVDSCVLHFFPRTPGDVECLKAFNRQPPLQVRSASLQDRLTYTSCGNDQRRSLCLNGWRNMRTIPFRDCLSNQLAHAGWLGRPRTTPRGGHRWRSA